MSGSVSGRVAVKVKVKATIESSGLMRYNDNPGPDGNATSVGVDGIRICVV